MVSMILAHLRRRRGRSLALLIGILVASTGFTVLTSDASATRLKVTTSVQTNARAAYDILVRPRGSRDAVEVRQGVVAPDFLSGQYGGITLAQWRAVRSIGGIDVAAPVAMIGYVTVYSFFDVDLTKLVDPRKETQVIRVDRTWSADRRLTTVPDPAPQYVYVTKRPVVFATGVSASGDAVQWSDGRKRPLRNRCNRSGDAVEAAAYPFEIEPDGSERALCQTALEAPDKPHVNLIVVRMLPDGTFMSQNDDVPRHDLALTFDWPISMLLAAVDPAAEARLVGVDKAVTSGHYLSPTAPPLAHDGDLRTRSIPVVATDAPDLDEQLRVRAATLDVPAGMDVAQPSWLRATPVLPRELATAAVTPVTDTTYQLTDQYRQLVSAAVTSGTAGISSFAGGVTFSQAGPVTFDTGPGGALRAVASTGQLTALAPQDGTMGNDGTVNSMFLDDTGFRQVKTIGPFDDLEDGTRVEVDAVGTFDPDRLTGFSPLSAVSLETYRSPVLTAGDAASAAALGAQPLRANSNMAGYVASPPTLLTSLAAVDFLKLKAPISAIRVRVAGVTGVDPVSRERVRVAAQRIEADTGLDVDITVGSSPAPQTVDLTAGRFGRPALVLSEGWTRKGVALAVIRALDRKSLVLFVLILVVCLLFLSNAVTAAVRDRRRELAILACLGWPRGRLATVILGEVLLVGSTAGAVSAAVALPVAHLAGVPLAGTHALLAVPVAVGLAALAAALPAWRGARVPGAAALVRTGVTPRRARAGRRRTVAAMAAANLLRNPGRTFLAALALAVGVAAVTVLVAITSAFHGSITGSLLGDAISLQVRGVDAVSVVATVALGLVAVADVVYLGIRERAAEFATLRAIGWTDATLARLVTYEGLGIGLLGAVAGAVAGIAAIATFGGTFNTALGWAAAATAAGGILLTAAACLVPAGTQRHLPTSTLLAEE